jgi:hypothetical protein
LGRVFGEQPATKFSLAPIFHLSRVARAVPVRTAIHIPVFYIYFFIFYIKIHI